MRDIDAPFSYSQGNEAEFRKEVNKGVNACYSTDRDVFVNMDQRFCLQSPDGAWWRFKVDNAGVISTEAVTP